MNKRIFAFWVMLFVVFSFVSASEFGYNNRDTNYRFGILDENNLWTGTNTFLNNVTLVDATILKVNNSLKIYNLLGAESIYLNGNGVSTFSNDLTISGESVSKWLYNQTSPAIAYINNGDYTNRNLFDQNLNTTDYVSFAGLNISADGGNIRIGGNGIGGTLYLGASDTNKITYSNQEFGFYTAQPKGFRFNSNVHINADLNLSSNQLVSNLDMDRNWIKNAVIWGALYGDNPGNIQPAYQDTLYLLTERGFGTVTSNKALISGSLGNMFSMNNNQHAEWGGVSPADPVIINITIPETYLNQIDIVFSWRNSHAIDYTIDLVEDANDDGVYTTTRKATVTDNSKYIVSHPLNTWRVVNIIITVTEAGNSDLAGKLRIGTIQAPSANHGKATGELADLKGDTFYGAVIINTTSSPTNAFTTYAEGQAGVRAFSGKSNNYTAIQIGRTSADGTLGVVASSGQWATGSLSGDIVIRQETNGRKIHLGVTGATAREVIELNLTTINNNLTITGNTGIGTANPTAKFEVLDGGTVTTGQSLVDFHQDDANVWGLRIFNNAFSSSNPTLAILGQTAGGVSLYNQGGATLHLNNEKVGIGRGMSSPGVQLDINGSGTGTNYVRFTNEGNVGGFIAKSPTPALGLQDIQGNSAWIQTDAGVLTIQNRSTTLAWISSPYSLNLNAPTDSLVVDSSGGVGIGTASPMQKLHVVGNSNITGTMYTGGNIISTSNPFTITSNVGSMMFYSNGGRMFFRDKNSNYAYTVLTADWGTRESVLAVPDSLQNTLTLTNYTSYTVDHGLTLQTDPTFCLQSATSPSIDRYARLCLRHNKTEAQLDIQKGRLFINNNTYIKGSQTGYGLQVEGDVKFFDDLLIERNLNSTDGSIYLNVLDSSDDNYGVFFRDSAGEDLGNIRDNGAWTIPTLNAGAITDTGELTANSNTWGNCRNITGGGTSIKYTCSTGEFITEMEYDSGGYNVRVQCCKL